MRASHAFRADGGGADARRWPTTCVATTDCWCRPTWRPTARRTRRCRDACTAASRSPARRRPSPARCTSARCSCCCRALTSPAAASAASTTRTAWPRCRESPLPTARPALPTPTSCRCRRTTAVGRPCRATPCRDRPGPPTGLVRRRAGGHRKRQHQPRHGGRSRWCGRQRHADHQFAVRCALHGAGHGADPEQVPLHLQPAARAGAVCRAGQAHDVFDGAAHRAEGRPAALRAGPARRAAHLSVGAAGSRNPIAHGMSLQEAVEAPRPWTQGFDLELGPRFNHVVPDALRARGRPVLRVPILPEAPRRGL